MLRLHTARAAAGHQLQTVSAGSDRPLRLCYTLVCFQPDRLDWE